MWFLLVKNKNKHDLVRFRKTLPNATYKKVLQYHVVRFLGLETVARRKGCWFMIQLEMALRCADDMANHPRLISLVAEKTYKVPLTVPSFS